MIYKTRCDAIVGVYLNKKVEDAQWNDDDGESWCHDHDDK